VGLSLQGGRVNGARAGRSIALIFQFWRSDLADVYVDAVSIFTILQPVNSTVTWTVPGGDYRGQGVWVRYTNGSNHFLPFAEANTVLP